MDPSLNRVALQTIIAKEITRVLRIWVQTIVPPAITMTLYFIIFGNLIGQRIGTMDGMLTVPVSSMLNGSTFATVRVEGPEDYPEPPPIDCAGTLAQPLP